MKKSILEIYALSVCFVTLVCFVIVLGIGIYDLIQISNPEFTLNPHEYERHRSNEAFRRSPRIEMRGVAGRRPLDAALYIVADGGPNGPVNLEQQHIGWYCLLPNGVGAGQQQRDDCKRHAPGR